MKNLKVFALAAIAMLVGALSFPQGASGQAIFLPSTLSPGSLTLIEGQSGVLDGSVTNNTSATIFLGGTTLMDTLLHGDPTDSLSSALTNDLCSNTDLASGSMCTFQVSLSTPSGTGETDDAGYWLVEVVGGGGNPNGTYDFLPSTDVTVESPASPAATPEPASFLLFGTGLIGLALAVRKRSRQQKEAASHQQAASSRRLVAPAGADLSF